MSLYPVGVDLASLQNAGGVQILARNSVTFVAGTTGAVGAHALFNVTGSVLITGMYGVVDTTMDDAGATATLDIGITNATTLFTGDGAIGGSPTAGQVWEGGYNSPWTSAGIRIQGVIEVITTEDVIYTVNNEAITTGVASFYLTYTPLSAGASVVAA